MRPSRFVLRLCLAMGLCTSGCAVKRDRFQFCGPTDLSCNQPALGVTQLEPSTAALCPDRDAMYAEPDSPLSLDESTLSPDRLIPMTLEDCIKQALMTSKIMRDLGGTVVRTPQTINSMADPALVYSDPRAGEEAALSAFDANLFVSNYFESNDRRLNNSFFGQGGLFTQNLNTTQAGVNKRSATGGLYTLRKFAVYDRNNQLSNTFAARSWDNYVEAEMRQPLLQGAGTEFNRIAGPGAAPGQLNGVLLARVRTDISLTDFERSVRDLVADVENAYWDLYYSYRDLEARIAVRDIAIDTERQLAEAATGAGKRAQAEEQVLRFQSEVVDAINGRPLDATRLNNGSAAGTFRSSGGIRVSERKLRLMIGLPINDGRLIRPTQAPTMSPVSFDWNSSIAEALQHREELRRQRWVIKQRELELIANRNFLRPQLDMIGRYRLRGFGKDLLGQESAYESLWDGQFQEWMAGVEYNMPIGFRRAAAAVQNSRLSLSREVEVLKEQERFVHFGLSNAIAEAKRAQENLELQRQRLVAIVKQLDAIDSRQDSERAELDVRLETHRRLLDARLRFHQAEVEYALALRNVNFEKGTLLQYCNVNLTESMSEPKAQMDAAERIEFRDFDRQLPSRDGIVGRRSSGTAAQLVSAPANQIITGSVIEGGVMPTESYAPVGSADGSTVVPAPASPLPAEGYGAPPPMQAPANPVPAEAQPVVPLNLQTFKPGVNVSLSDDLSATGSPDVARPIISIPVSVAPGKSPIAPASFQRNLSTPRAVKPPAGPASKTTPRPMPMSQNRLW